MDQLGQSQVLPYLRVLARKRSVTLISFEKRDDFDNAERRAQFDHLTGAANIRWIPLRYHQRPSTFSTAFDLTVGLLVCIRESIRSDIQIVHARGYVSAVLGLALKYLFRHRFIFDTRGFWLIQRVELGIWRRDSLMFAVGQWFENRFIQDADVVFALTADAVTAMKVWPAARGRDIQFEVVTTCTDLDLFTLPPSFRPFHGAVPFTLGYVGSAGAGYLFEQVLDLFRAVLERVPNARLKIVNRRDHEFIKERLARRQIALGSVDLEACDHAQVPSRMWEMDAGVFFVRPDPSRISSVPTRMGEFLACGVPCIGNAGVADVVNVLEGDGVGVVLRSFDPVAIRVAVDTILALSSEVSIRARCAEVASRRFSLTRGAAVYESVYQRLESAAQ